MRFKTKQQMDNSRNNIKINFIEPNTKVIGEIHSESDFRIDGTLEGTVQTTGRVCLLYTSPSPRDVEESRMPSSA